MRCNVSQQVTVTPDRAIGAWVAYNASYGALLPTRSHLRRRHAYATVGGRASVLRAARAAR